MAAPAPRKRRLRAPNPESPSRRESIPDPRADLAPPGPPVRRKHTDSSAPLSFAQQRLWILDQIEDSTSVHIAALGYRVTGPLDRARLGRAVDEVVRRHEVLRTTIATRELLAMAETRAVQIVADPTPGALRAIEIDEPVVDEAAALRFALENARRRFDLLRGPLFRAFLVPLAVDDALFVLSAHRTIADVRSLEIVNREVWTLYGADASPESTALTEPELQYGDYAVWQRSVLQGEALARRLDYWKERLAGAPGVIDLPTDRQRPPVQSFRGATVRQRLHPELVATLRALAESEGSSLAAVLLAGFQALLARYTGQYDLVVGTTVDDRDRIGAGDLVGPYTNALALRSELDGDTPFVEALRRTDATLLRDLAHEDLPIEALVEALATRRDLSHAPLYQVAFSHRRAPAEPQTHGGLSIERVELDLGIAELDLALSVEERDAAADVALRFNTELFDGESARRMLEHFRVLLDAVASQPATLIAELPLLAEGERNLLLVEWNDTAAEVPRDLCIHDLFERSVERTPGAVAAVFDGIEASYAELESRSNRLANYLRSAGVGPGVLVGICVERGLDMIVGLLGILKAGGAYVPLDPAYPEERIAFMIGDAAVRVLVTQAHLVERLGEHEAALVCLDADGDAIAESSDVRPERLASPADTAYVIFTSGSTGKPKGVQIPHSALVNFLATMAQRPGLSPEDRLLAVTTLSFDIAGLEIFLPLSVGASVEVVGREIAADAARLCDALAASSATVMQATPATWRMLLETGWRGDDRLKVLCGGEALTRELAVELGSRAREVWNLYGPTETTVWSTAYRVGSTGAHDGPTEPIGRPIANTRLYILDQLQQPVPIGVPGELHIAGAGVAIGYLNRPELTAERFIPEPFDGGPGARMYRTGDLARYLTDGNVEFLGRIDNQVKVRGFRIELGEIEAVLRNHSAVRDAVVVARDDALGSKRLVAYIVADGVAMPSVGELRAHLAAELPEYMVPALFVPLEAFPLTANGKIDRRALPAPDEGRPELGDTVIPARDGLEQQLVEMWEKLLAVRPVGIKDNFFELGGDSLLAVRLFAQISNSLGRNLPLATLFQAPTVEQLGEALRAEAGTELWPSLVTIREGGSQPPLFCVHAGGANVLIFRPLARHLKADRPIYALQARGLDGQTEPLNSVEKMAAYYIREIKTVQPDGPYHLVGASFGGLVAYEMARRLHDAGDEVALVAMLNTPCPPASPLERRVRALERRLVNYALFSNGANWLVRQAARTAVRLRGWGAVLRDAEEPGAKQPIRPGKTLVGTGGSRALAQTVKGIMRAERRYLLPKKAFQGPITLFWAVDHVPLGGDHRLGWRRVAGPRFEVYEIPGDHASLREEPNVSVLAARLDECLDRASEGHRAHLAVPVT